MTVILLLMVYGIVLSYALSQRRLPARTPSTESSGPRPRRILVVGATGGTGRHLVAQALERGYDVTAFVRTPSRLQIEDAKLTVVQGDILDAAAVRSAVENQDAVLCALGHTRYFTGPRILSQGTENLVRAMEAGGVRRLVCETSLGIGRSAFLMGLYYTFIVIPFILPLYYWDKTRQERVIAGSDLDWVIVRPGALTNGRRRGSCRHGTSGIGNFLWTVRVSRADVAAFMLEQLETDDYLGAAVGVSG